MAEIIRMPKMSDTMTEGVIASWLVKVGDKVKAGDILAEVETDKATMELENYVDGILLHIGIEAKQAAVVDGIIAIVGQQGEDISALLTTNTTPSPKNEVLSSPALQTASSKPIDTSNIAAVAIRMPKMSDTMTEGVIASWLVKVGDKVKSGDILAEVETDKATMELENFENGTVLYLGVEAGKGVPVDGIIAIVGENGTDYTPLLASPKTEAQKASPKTETVVAAQATPSVSVPSVQDSSRLKASPLAKKLAAEKGFDIALIKGTGENGRIVKKDIENFVPTKAATPSVATTLTATEGFTDIPVSQMRKTIAKRLSESKFTAPHFYLTMETASLTIFTPSLFI